MSSDLGLVGGLGTQAEVLLDHVLIQDGAADAHAHGAQLQVAVAPGGLGGDGAADEPQQLRLHVVGNGVVADVLHVVPVDAEHGQALLRGGSQRGGQEHGARTLGAVEAPDGLDGVGIHVGDLGGVAPAGRHGQGDLNAFLFKLRLAGSRLGHAADGGVGNDDLDLFAVGIAEIVLDQLLGGQGQTHGLLLQALALPDVVAVDGVVLPAAIDAGTDADGGHVHFQTIHETTSYVNYMPLDLRASPGCLRLFYREFR